MNKCRIFGHKWDYLEPHAAWELGASWDVKCKRCGVEDWYQCNSWNQWFNIGEAKMWQEATELMSSDKLRANTKPKSKLAPPNHIKAGGRDA